MNIGEDAMKYIEASVQVVELNNQDVVTASTKTEVYNVLGQVLGNLTPDQVDQKLASAGWENGIEGLLKALEEGKIPSVNSLHKISEDGPHTLSSLHNDVCGGTASSNYSNDAEDFDDSEWNW